MRVVSEDLKMVTVANPRGFLPIESINFPLMLPCANNCRQAIVSKAVVMVFFISGSLVVQNSIAKQFITNILGIKLKY